jgi:hypothetical protein
MKGQDQRNDNSSMQGSVPKRGLLLRILYRVYVNYLGVTPPTPAQERTAAVVLIGGVVLGLGGSGVLLVGDDGKDRRAVR